MVPVGLTSPASTWGKASKASTWGRGDSSKDLEQAQALKDHLKLQILSWMSSSVEMTSLMTSKEVYKMSSNQW
jgi:hypothetical protein